MTRVSPGLLGEAFREAGVRVEIADLEAGNPFPQPGEFNALVVMGGPDSANHQTVKLRPGMELPSAGKFCPHQIVKTAPKAWGFQCHFELTRDLFEDWKKEDSDLVKMDPALLDRDFKEVGEEYR